jgi:serine O-acetyltransferase
VASDPWTNLRADGFRYRAETSKKALRDAWRREPGFRFLWYLRKLAYYAQHKRGIGIFPYAYHRFMLNHYRFRYGLDISPLTQIGPGLFIGHFGGVVISPMAVIGSNVNIAQGVTIGAINSGARKGAPVLEDRVWVGANAIIVGKVSIGADTLIAPGAYVNFDVPPGSTVLGNPGQIVSQKGSKGYVNNLYSGEA